MIRVSTKPGRPQSTPLPQTGCDARSPSSLTSARWKRWGAFRPVSTSMKTRFPASWKRVPGVAQTQASTAHQPAEKRDIPPVTLGELGSLLHAHRSVDRAADARLLPGAGGP